MHVIQAPLAANVVRMLPSQSDFVRKHFIPLLEYRNASRFIEAREIAGDVSIEIGQAIFRNGLITLSV
jgi:hypothetical protein